MLRHAFSSPWGCTSLLSRAWDKMGNVENLQLLVVFLCKNAIKHEKTMNNDFRAFLNTGRMRICAILCRMHICAILFRVHL
jgi:hypothetical protein